VQLRWRLSSSWRIGLTGLSRQTPWRVQWWLSCRLSVSACPGSFPIGQSIAQYRKCCKKKILASQHPQWQRVTRKFTVKTTLSISCCNQAITLLTLAGIGGLIRQLDSIRVFPFPFVLFGKNLF
jgi:hypothetical protein